MAGRMMELHTVLWILVQVQIVSSQSKSRKNAKDGCFPSGLNLESTVLPALCLASLTCPHLDPNWKLSRTKFLNKLF